MDVLIKRKQYNLINYFQQLDKNSYLIVLGMLYATIFFSSFIMGYKIIEFKGHIFCASVFIFPLLFPLNDTITELFGIKVSYLVITATIFFEFLFSFLTFILSSLPSSPAWANQDIYPILTSGFIHIAYADSFSLAIGFIANAYFLNKWGLRLSGKGFFIRSIGATAVGELIFTISTNIIAFKLYGHASTSQTINIIFSDYLFKMVYSLIVCIPNALVVNKIKLLYELDSEKAEINENVVSLSSYRSNFR